MPLAICPRCQSGDSTPVKYTWWGGVLGPKILKLVRCAGCGKSYNGETGQDVTGAIVVYVLVSSFLLAILFYFILRM